MKIYDYNGKKNICGDRLREARVVQRLRQEDLAAKIQTMGVNMERDSISRIEIGTRFVSDFELKVFAKVQFIPVALFFLVYFQNLLTYCNKYAIIKA